MFHTLYKLLLILVAIVHIGRGETNVVQQYPRARIESCPGCSLNRLPDVKKFIFEDVPKYENVEFKKISGAPPELVLLNDNDEEMERLILGRLNRKECNELLIKYGFQLKEAIDSKLEL